MPSVRAPTEAGAVGRATWLFATRTTVAAALLFAALVLLVVIALATLGDHSFRYYASDPAVVLGAMPLVGLMSHAGILAAWGGAAVSAFSGLLVAWAWGWRAGAPLVLLGLGVGYAALDDLFVLHEDIYLYWLGLPEKVVLGAYVVGLIAVLWSFRDFFRAHDWKLLALAFGVLAVSFTLDLGVRDVTVKRWAEDVTKLVGLALLAAYLVRLSARVLLESYTLAPRDAAEPAQSSEPPANAVATPRPT